MGQTVRMLRQRITGITYKTQTWKTDLPIIMCAAMESYRRKMTKNCAWHCGYLNGNLNFLSIEVCQSMGDLDTFKANEEKALQLAAQKCKQYGITPSASTIMLHQEVFATACPHRSVEIHGGATATKKRIFIKTYQRTDEWKSSRNRRSGRRRDYAVYVYSRRKRMCFIGCMMEL